MPVELERIPAREKLPPLPNFKRWLLLGIVMLLAGAAATFLYWKGEHSGAAFWGLATGLPVVLWGLLIVGRYLGYVLLCRRSEKKNATTAARFQADIARGQRFAWLIGEVLINGLGPDSPTTHKAVLAKKPLMMPCEPVNGGNPVRHRALAVTGEMADREAHYLPGITAHVQNLVALLPPSLACYLAVDTGEQFLTLPSFLQKSVPHPLVRIRDLTGLELLDYWLDCHYDRAAALLVVSAQLYEHPPEDSGEAISVLLLTNCRLKNIPDVSVRVHRPQICRDGNIGRAFERIMMWSGLEKTALQQAWTSGGQMVSGDIFSKAREAHAPGLNAEKIKHIDTVAGFAGVAAPWQALQLATRQCLSDSQAQLIVTELAEDNRQLCIVTPE
ncbi:hypothetical protein [Shimwellia blattae]|uniref:Uncharacterized protein n=1 Tax=Shimwellia blattae (strain ATCC 29907 / DSM 4481 / JCM 1650 / NBRC 105725 / CDC 9005-74) TaxID=630626 RepID=I2B6X9_SHIBC|nr:hypothetical protein [Shimwellia blattae]AFJ46283.1 hypothetical protein EBL_c11790 [Shimwellia blattae DSM 4481 = NBRC 105725]GAB83022.1 hypothetical protein EB105725_40_00240 [Shimwellia blattae DSM 4481 = NBRC 105725]VDY63749.1 Uncharacterised protein [Shimwellia blattae]VEC21890.1 Uncharacterised protein [Shimwellia blattae]